MLTTDSDTELQQTDLTYELIATMLLGFEDVLVSRVDMKTKFFAVPSLSFMLH